MTKAADYTLYTDAAATIWYGGFFQNKWFQAILPPELVLTEIKQLSMAFLEQYPIVVHLCCGGQSGGGRENSFLLRQ